MPSLVSILISFFASSFYWVSFFSEEGAELNASDWVKEQAFADVIRDALTHMAIPWTLSEPYYHGVHEFMANPEVSFLPDALLLLFISNKSYFFLHFAIFHVAGFFGLYLISKRLGVSSLPFMLISALYSMNGYITSHISVGHIQWVSYFLLPYYLLFMVDVTRSSGTRWRRALMKMGLLLAVMLMNGSLHIAVWCLMLMVLGSFFEQSLIRSSMLIILSAGFTGIARLLPAALYFPEKVDYYGGYPSIGILLDAISSSLNGPGFLVRKAGWHEYDAFVGFVGLTVLILGVYLYVRERASEIPRWLWIASLLMLLMSLGDVYQVIPRSGLPFASIERVSSRFVVMPLFVSIVISGVGITALERKCGRPMVAILMLSFISLAGELYSHSKVWSLSAVQRTYGIQDIPHIIGGSTSDQIYKMVVLSGWLFSLMTITAMIFYLVKRSH